MSQTISLMPREHCQDNALSTSIHTRDGQNITNGYGVCFIMSCSWSNGLAFLSVFFTRAVQNLFFEFGLAGVFLSLFLLKYTCEVWELRSRDRSRRLLHGSIRSMLCGKTEMLRVVSNHQNTQHLVWTLIFISIHSKILHTTVVSTKNLRIDPITYDWLNMVLR